MPAQLGPRRGPFSLHIFQLIVLNDLHPAPRGTLCRDKEKRASTRKEKIGRKKMEQKRRERTSERMKKKINL